MYRRTRQSQSKLPPDTVDSSPRTRQSMSKPPPDTVDSSSSDMHRRTRQSQSKLPPDTVDGSPRTRQSKSKPPPDTVYSSPRTRQSKSKPPPDTVDSSSRTRQSISKPPPDTVDSSSTTRQSISKPPPDTVDSSSSDSDSDNYQNHLSASDVINSFLQPNRTVVHVYTPRCRKASDVVNSFLQKSKTVDRASPSQFDSALDVINSYLRRDNFGKNGRSAGISAKRECSDSSSSESDTDPEFLAKKRRRRMTESSTSDSDSDANPKVSKKRRIEDSGAENARAAAIVNSEPIHDMKIEPAPSSAHDEYSDAPENPTPSTTSTTVNEGPIGIHASTAEDPEHSKGDQTEVPAQRTSNSTRRRTLRSHASKENTPLQNVNKTMSKRKAPAFFQMTFKREVVSKKMRTRRIIEQQTTIRDYQIPKEKYDRALDMLNAVECRYDETPVDYNAPRLYYDFRQNCNRRRHAEATYDTDKIAIPAHSLTRIVCELDNCLKTENWSRMAELIYFGCGLMKTDHIRRAIGGAFFTYALLLLILDSSTNSISTLSGKRSEIQKFLTALGNDPEDTEEFLKQLHLVTNENDTPNGLLTIKCEEE